MKKSKKASPSTDRMQIRLAPYVKEAIIAHAKDKGLTRCMTARMLLMERMQQLGLIDGAT
jgi:hypothetical protein